MHTKHQGHSYNQWAGCHHQGKRTIRLKKGSGRITYGQVPLKAPHRGVLRETHFERVIIYDLNIGTYHGGVVPTNAIYKWL